MTIEGIINIFCEQAQVSYDQLISSARSAKLWYIRYMLWHYLHYTHGWSASRLAKYFNRNRPSIFRGIRILKYQMKYHKKIKADYESIVKIVENQSFTN